MVRSISVGLVTQALLEFAEENFPELLGNRRYREDALQVLTMVELFSETKEKAKRAVARRALAWLAYEHGLSKEKPRYEQPTFRPLPKLERGTFFHDLSAAREETLEAERMAA
jgi:hypothetical protein